MGLLVRTTCYQYLLQSFSFIFHHFLLPMLFWWLCFSFQRQFSSYQSRRIENYHGLAPLLPNSCSCKIQMDGLSTFQFCCDCSLLWLDFFIYPFSFDLICLKRSLDWLFGLFLHFIHRCLRNCHLLLAMLWNYCFFHFAVIFVGVFCTFFFAFWSCRWFRDCIVTLFVNWTFIADTTVLVQDN